MDGGAGQDPRAVLSAMCDRHADAERAALLALFDAGPDPQLLSEVLLRGSARAVWDESHAGELLGGDDAVARAAATLQHWRDAGLQLVTVLDAEYPVALRSIHQLPPWLFADGTLRPDDVGVGVVGARAATAWGRMVATNIATSLVRKGFSVISGLAAGIDTAAHEATLAAGGRPVAVLGTGITTVYPEGAGSAALHRRVAAAGVLYSQFRPEATPVHAHFPLRNITLSGLGVATVIVEAGEHSGTRGLAREALGHCRPIILTDLVAKSCTWAADLVTRPGVFVAGNTAEVLAIVAGILDEGRRDDSVLSPILQ